MENEYPVITISDKSEGPFYGPCRYVVLPPGHPEGFKYRNRRRWGYYSDRYQKWVWIESGELSNGADVVIDINSRSWWVHDKLKRDKKWADGTPCSNWQASWVLRDILMWEAKRYNLVDRWLRARTWFYGTLIYGDIKECLWALLKGLVRL